MIKLNLLIVSVFIVNFFGFVAAMFLSSDMNPYFVLIFIGYLVLLKDIFILPIIVFTITVSLLLIYLKKENIFSIRNYFCFLLLVFILGMLRVSFFNLTIHLIEPGTYIENGEFLIKQVNPEKKIENIKFN